MLFEVPKETHKRILAFINQIFVFFHLFLYKISQNIPLILLLINFFIIFIYFHFFAPQKIDVRQLWLSNKKQGFSVSSSSCCSTDSVDERVAILRGIVLYNPVDFRNINTSRCQISCQKYEMMILLICLVQLLFFKFSVNF